MLCFNLSVGKQLWEIFLVDLLGLAAAPRRVDIRGVVAAARDAALPAAAAHARVPGALQMNKYNPETLS